MRIFKTKPFARWARKEEISDTTLCGCARDIAAGKVDANLGGYLFKKRIPRPGQGKSGSYRIIVAFKSPEDGRLFFLYGFPKNSKSNISTSDEYLLKIIADRYINISDTVFRTVIRNGDLVEISE
ncbi:MAG: type II toxin-antitoxin system RelE/ParE family toxin [Thermodesulfobacteriota bacterium]